MRRRRGICAVGEESTEAVEAVLVAGAALLGRQEELGEQADQERRARGAHATARGIYAAAAQEAATRGLLQILL